MSEDSRFDFSTLDLAAIAKLPQLGLNEQVTPKLHASVGVDCFMDPPGYPTYFLRRSVAESAPQAMFYIGDRLFVADHDCIGAEPSSTWLARRLRSLWKPLPLSHPRTQLWIHCVYSLNYGSYLDPTVPEEQVMRSIFLWPRYDAFQSPVGTDEHAILCAGRFEEDLRKEVERVVKPENHSAVVWIRQYYPEHSPREDWIAAEPNPSYLRVPMWWTVQSVAPTSFDGCRPPVGAHPYEGRPCKWCMFTEAE